MSSGPLQSIAPCVVSHNLALGGAQIAVLRMISALPDWVRDRTTLFCQSDDMPLLDAAYRNGFSVGSITRQAPADASCWVLSYGDLTGLPERPTSVLLHSWDDEGWRYINKAYGHLRGVTVAGVSGQVLDRFAPWVARGGHSVAGVLPPPVTEFASVKGRLNKNRIVVVWMGRPLESKGLLTLPYLLALDPRIVVRAYTGAETAAHAYTRRKQAETLDKLLKLARKLKVLDRLDLRPLSFDAFSYQDRLRGAHVLLGNSEREGFLLTAAEALSCGVPAVVTRSCGVADFVTDEVNGALIDWNANPRKLAKAAYAAILRAIPCKAMTCLASAESLSLAAGYRKAHGGTLARMTHTSLQCDTPRVTIAVRIHKGMPIEHLDDAVSSVALQTCRQFKTILLVDGDWAYGEYLAGRYDLPLICTGLEPDITHCSGLHRRGVEQCDTEFYKPLDYDDQLLPDYLGRALATLDGRPADVYGCLLTTLEDGVYGPRKWPHKPLETMFTGNSDDNMLPHSSVMMRTASCRLAGNYQEKAVGLGADDYHLWYRLFKTGARFVRDDAVRNVVYRIHEKNSLKIRRARYGPPPAPAGQGGLGLGRLIAGATAASIALWAVPNLKPGGAGEATQTGTTDRPLEKAGGTLPNTAPPPPDAATVRSSADAAPDRDPKSGKPQEKKRPIKVTPPTS